MDRIHPRMNGCYACQIVPQYGYAFQQNGHVYNLTLACLDSDGDGYTNGGDGRTLPSLSRKLR